MIEWYVEEEGDMRKGKGEIAKGEAGRKKR